MSSKTELNNKPRSNKLPTVLSLEEQKALLDVPNLKTPTGLRNYCMMLMFLNLGLRVGEALSLKVSDIDWNTGKLNVIAGKGNKDRVLWISDNDLAKLQLWRDKMPGNSAYLFCTLEGGPIIDRYVRAFIKRYTKRAGINKRVHPHCLRHSFATDLLHDSKNIRLVQKALGHASLATTMIYTHIADDQLESALKQFREGSTK